MKKLAASCSALALSAALFLSLLTSDAGAVATTSDSAALSTSTYTDLGTGPFVLSAVGSGLEFVYGDSLPGTGVKGHALKPSDPAFNAQTAQHVYARATSAYQTVARISVASAWGGGSSGASSQPVGAATLTPTQTSCASTATLIAAARTGVAGTGRISDTITNTTTTAVYIGNSGVTTSTGQLLPGVVGASLTLNVTAAIYCIVASGTVTVTNTETY